MDLAVVERDRLMAMLNEEQLEYIARVRDKKTRELWIRALCEMTHIEIPKEADVEGFAQGLKEYIYVSTLIGESGTEPYRCQRCGCQLRNQYTLQHSESGVNLKLGIECFKQVLDVDKQVDMTIRAVIDKGASVLMDILIAYREKNIEAYLPIIAIDEAPELYRKQIGLGLPLTKKQDKDFEHWYRDYVYVEYEEIVQYNVSRDAIYRAKIALPLTNTQLGQYRKYKSMNKRQIK